MRNRSILTISFALLVTGSALAQPQIGGGTCSVSSLLGNYWSQIGIRAVSSSGTFEGVAQQLALITFDGKGNFTFAGTQSGTSGTGKEFSGSGTLTINSDCSGTVTIPGGVNYTLVVYNGGNTFNASGTGPGGSTAAVNGGLMPSSCLISMLSGPFAVNGNGFTIASSAVSGVDDFNGILTFDGAGNVTANLTITSGTTMTPISAHGTYVMNTPSECMGTIALGSADATTFAASFAVTNPNGDFQLIAAAPPVILQGSGHPVFHNPGQSVTNGASFISGEAAPGSIFSIFGENLGPNPPAFGSVLPLPSTLEGIRVTVNGEDAPLFYSGTGQINAQVPVDVKPGLATVVVANGNATSNAAAVFIPQAAPGIFTYGAENHAVVINPHGHLNTEAVPAHIGDTVVVYFTGGGPVTPSGPWETGAASPLGISPLTTTNYSLTVNGKPATVSYIGLTGGSVGLYQANFVVPQVIAGDHPLVITVNGVKSKAATITISD